MPEVNNQRDYKNLRIAVEIIGVALAIGIAWATLRGSVINNSQDITSLRQVHEKDIEVVNKHIQRGQEQVVEISGNIREMNVRQEVMADDVKEIKEKLK